MKKVFVILLALCCLGLAACGAAAEQAQQEAERGYLIGDKLVEEYDLNSEEILFITDADMIFGGDHPQEVIKITDPAEIKSIVENANPAEWKTGGSFYEGLYEWEAIFDGRIGMRFGDNFSYCCIYNVTPNGDGTYSHVDGGRVHCDYDLPEEFTVALQNVVQSHAK